MAKKRLRKKQAKKEQIKRLQNFGITEIPKTEPERIAIISKESRKEKKRESNRKYREKQKRLESDKRKLLEIVSGVPMDKWERGTLGKLKNYSLEDIQAGKVQVGSNVNKPIKSNKIIYDELYKVPGGKKLSFAFRSLSGEIDIADELERFSSWSIQELVENINKWAHKPLTRTKRQKGRRGWNTGSSGRAGEGRIDLLTPGSLKELHYKYDYNYNRRAKTYNKKRSQLAKERGLRYQHTEHDYHWQYISQKTEDGNFKAYTEISIRKLLIIGNAIIENIVESDRYSFYKEFKQVACEIIPLMKSILI